MSSFRKVIWSPVEVEWLKGNKKLSVKQLTVALSKSDNAVKKKLRELSGKKNKSGLVLSEGPTKNRRSYIGKRPDCDNLFMRSGYEANCYRWFKHVVKPTRIEYEPQTFTYTQFGIVRGTLSYTPDFKITYPDGNYKWFEVKGFLGSQDSAKMHRFKKYFPEEFIRLTVIVGRSKSKTGDFFRKLGVLKIVDYSELNKEFRHTIPGWE